jgi:hypothetical protein
MDRDKIFKIIESTLINEGVDQEASAEIADSVTEQLIEEGVLEEQADSDPFN